MYAGLSRELFVTPRVTAPVGAPVNQDCVIVGGDFNFSPDPDRPNAWRNSYGFFDMDYGLQPYESGAHCVSDSFRNSTAGTTIQLDEWVKQPRKRKRVRVPILENTVAPYLKMPIDKVFYRGFVPTEGPQVLNPMVEVSSDSGTDCESAIAYYTGLLASATKACPLIDAKGPYWPKATGKVKKTYAFPSINSWVDFITGVNDRGFDTPRCQAEFVRMCVSDHLPLVLKMPL